MALAAREREEAQKKAREDEETRRQLREARVEFDVVHDDGDRDPDINDGVIHNYMHPQDKEVVELPESDGEDNHYEVSFFSFVLSYFFP